MDSPEQFVKDIVDADKGYFDGYVKLNFAGITRISDFLGFPHMVFEPVLFPLLEKGQKNMDSGAEEIKAVIDNPPKCIEKEDIYQAVQYISKVEGPWTVKFIDSTILKEYVTVPENTDELFSSLSHIPKCYES